MPLLLAETSGSDVGLLVGITGGIGAVGGALKLVWSYWTTKLEALEKTHAEQIKDLRDRQTSEVKDIRDRYSALLDERDEQITGLQKDLSRKSDEHAHKIESLQNVTLTKVEEMTGRHLELVERVIQVQAETNATLRAFRSEPNNRKGEV